MMVVQWLGFTFGLLLVVATALSAARMLVVPRSRPSGFTRPVERATWTLIRGIARRLGSYERIDAFLAGAGAAKLAVLAGCWLLLFWLAYGLMLLPFTELAFGEALRESGSSMLTLGFASTDSVAATAIDFLASLSGFGIITLFIAYLPTLYSAFSRRETLVTTLDSRGGSPPWGPEILARHQLVDIVDDLGVFYQDWEAWAADVAESHSNYPVLISFRSPLPQRSWLIGLLAVCDAAAMHLALCPSTAPSQARLVVRMGFVCFRTLADTVGIAYDPDPRPDDPIELSYDDFLAGVEHLERAGFTAERPPEEAWPHFHGWRVNYESVAYELADHIVAPPTAWSGPRSLIGEPAYYPERPAHRDPDHPAGEEGEDAATMVYASDRRRARRS
ncbi:MAG TPA: hypothetical protein VFZ70_12475 [Euzebyales bacterium]